MIFSLDQSFVSVRVQISNFINSELLEISFKSLKSFAARMEAFFAIKSFVPAEYVITLSF